MDGSIRSGAAVAMDLGTTVPRLVRAVERLELDARMANGRLALTAGHVNALRAELGVTPAIERLSPVEVKALAALSRSPLGVCSARKLARRAGLSPTAAARAFTSLAEKGLSRREQTTVAAGRARPMELLHAQRCSPRWPALAPQLRQVQPPRRPSAPTGRVPPALRHLFWNTAPAQLDVDHAGPYLARRLLRTMSPEGLAWGARALRPGDWREAAQARGLDAADRALAANLAAAGDR